ncbi:MAG: hypothetical protein NWE89_16895 [Candidatus Bathyarchaeota archaeon]|nr:hypothetical protein [Candidatus Bathyarchaeota archaeon]
MSKYGEPIWKIVLEAAKSLDLAVFKPMDVIRRVHEKYPEIPDTSIRTYVIAMAPEHPSSPHYPSTRRNHPYFKYHGSGRFSLDFTLTPVETKLCPVEGSSDPKGAFIEEYGDIVENWAEEHFEEVVEARRNYSWGDKPMLGCVRERNSIQTSIVRSRILNKGSVDLGTLDRVMDWGGLRHIALDEDEALRVTGEAFSLLDAGDLVSATLRLLSVRGVGIASASKVIGLYDQNLYAVYDSRVGTALRSLVDEDGVRLIKCPVGRGRPGDVCLDRVWAENYERLIWVLGIMGWYLGEKGYPFSVSDVEMALFMMGK